MTNPNQKVWVVEQKNISDAHWVACDVSVFYAATRAKLKDLRARWKEYKFRMVAYFPEEK